MTQRHKIQLFEDKKVRTAWDDEREEWYFSIVDVCAVLSESENPQTYWRVLKNRLKKEGNETVTNCNASKMLYKHFVISEKVRIFAHEFNAKINQLKIYTL